MGTFIIVSYFLVALLTFVGMAIYAGKTALKRAQALGRRINDDIDVRYYDPLIDITWFAALFWPFPIFICVAVGISSIVSRFYEFIFDIASKKDKS